ncbi:MAG: HEAT repeat domain-containing protein [Planctomycetia bacterium]|nr:HEAT repeat domain-containing protein [Planctomycetia bacterium]
MLKSFNTPRMSLFIVFFLAELILLLQFFLPPVFAQAQKEAGAAQELKPWPKVERRYTTSSPQVLDSLKKSIQFLEKNTFADREHRCGSAAIAGLAIYKYYGEADNPLFDKIVKSIEDTLQDYDPKDLLSCGIDNYSLGISLIFLAEVCPEKNPELRNKLLNLLYFRMRPYGGWGYMDRYKDTADTSMTQYGCLSLWTLKNAGYPIRHQVIDKTADWLLRTQDPSGAFGYQGKIGDENYTRVAQPGVRLSMAAAAMGSLYISADVLGFHSAAPKEEVENEFMDFELVEDDKKKKSSYRPVLPRLYFSRTIKDGNVWFQNNFSIEMKQYMNYNYYYLYALERYMSFQELAEKWDDPSPFWYSMGVEWLLSRQAEDGSWPKGEELVSDTAFGALFLLRSTKRSIEKVKDFGPGLLISGRGLPKNLDSIQLRGGKVVPKVPEGPTNDLMEALANPDSADYEAAVAALSEMPAELSQTAVTKYAAQLKQLVSVEDPQARQAAVRALGKSNNLDCVPVLIYALTDPDPQIALAANDGLKNLSRRLDNFGLKPGFTEADRKIAIDSWKEWFRTLRPDAVFEEY